MVYLKYGLRVLRFTCAPFSRVLTCFVPAAMVPLAVVLAMFHSLLDIVTDGTVVGVALDVVLVIVCTVVGVALRVAVRVIFLLFTRFKCQKTL